MSRSFLICDDAPPVRLMIEDALRQAGIPESHIMKVDDGKRALEAFEQNEPDVVFMDINMPGMDGQQATSYILNQNPRARVIVVTGLRPSSDEVRDVLSMGAFEVVHKPIRSDDVQEVLRELDKERPGHGRVL